MKRVSTSLCILSGIALLIQGGCSSTQATDHADSMTTQALQINRPASDECAYLNEEIEYAASLSNRMKDSRYAVYYQAMSRERVKQLQKQADVIGCNYPK